MSAKRWMVWFLVLILLFSCVGAYASQYSATVTPPTDKIPTLTKAAPFKLVAKKVKLTLGNGDFFPFSSLRGSVSARMSKLGVVAYLLNSSGKWTGYLRPVGTGTVKMTFKSGSKKASMKITVVKPAPTPTPTKTPTPTPTSTPDPSGKPVYRALSIGTGLGENGPDDLTTFPLDAKNFKDCLGQLSFEGRKLAVNRFVKNPTRSAAITAIKNAFSGATENDVSYLYIMCHGQEPSGGVYNIYIGADDKPITSVQLRSLLDQVPGKVNLILSCCFSGDAVGKSADNFADGFVKSFTAASKSGEMIGDKYNVICGSSRTQQGWVRYYTNLAGAWCLSGSTIARGAGWMYQGTTSPYAVELEADRNGDGVVTMREIYDYAEPLIKKLHVEYGIDMSDGLTQLCTYPYDDSVIFARN